MQNEPTDGSAQHFPANNILLLCRETRKTASFQQATRVISFPPPNELSLVFHFAPFSSLFVTASFSYYCSQKCHWLFFFFFFFLAHDLVQSVPSISPWLTHTPIVQEQWYFLFGLLDKCWYSWLALTKAHHSILMDLNSDSVYVSIILACTHIAGSPFVRRKIPSFVRIIHSGVSVHVIFMAPCHSWSGTVLKYIRYGKMLDLVVVKVILSSNRYDSSVSVSVWVRDTRLKVRLGLYPESPGNTCISIGHLHAADWHFLNISVYICSF